MPYGFFSCFKKILTAFISMYDFDAWDISHEFIIASKKDGRSSGIKEAMNNERENYEKLGSTQSSFHSAVNAVTAFERKHDEIVGIIK